MALRDTLAAEVASAAAKIAQGLVGTPDITEISDVMAKLLDFVDAIEVKQAIAKVDAAVEADTPLPEITEGTPFQYGPFTGVRVQVAKPTDWWTYTSGGVYYRVYTPLSEAYRPLQDALRAHDWETADLIWSQLPIYWKGECSGGSTSLLARQDSLVWDWFLSHGVRQQEGDTVPDIVRFMRQFNPNMVDGSAFARGGK